MRLDLDSTLCEKYPKIFEDRHKPMTMTAMCWGFDCGNGWYNIIDRLCANIQSHIDWTQNRYNNGLAYNAMVTDMLAGDFRSFEEYSKGWINDEYTEKSKQDILERGFRKLEAPCLQVVAEQVKEKFGTLRFYYRGGDDEISGMVRMAESMSGVTCEECGIPGTIGGGGWVRTLCETHRKSTDDL